MGTQQARTIHLLLLLALCVGGGFVVIRQQDEVGLEVPAGVAKKLPKLPTAQQSVRVTDTWSSPKQTVAAVPGSRAIELFERASGSGDTVRLGHGLPALESAMPGTRVLLPLPGGVNASVVLEKPTKRAGRDFSWLASVEGEPASMVALSVFEDAIAIQINSVKHGEQTLQWVAPGEFRWHQPDPTKPRCTLSGTVAPTLPPAPESAAMEPRSAGFGDAAPVTAASGPVAASATGPNFDVVVIYTAAARIKVGGLAQITAMANNSVTSLNGTFTRSSIDVMATLVHLHETNYVEASGEAVGTAFSRLTNTTDGHIDEAAGLRDAYGADMVALFIDGTGFGVGEINGFYSVVEADVASGVAPHEWGHNLGCGHDNVNGPQGIYSYSYAHYFTLGGTQYGTMMSYVGQRVAWFSNPNVNYTTGGNTAPTGVATTRDHALTITTNGAAVAARRTLNVTDYDADGVLNAAEPAGDLDGDLLLNERDADADGDGFSDGVEVTAGRGAYDNHLLFPFSTTSILDGWAATNITTPTVASGILSGTASTGDAQIARAGFDIDGSSNSRLRIRFTCSAATSVQLFWGTRDADSILGSRSLTVSYTTANVAQDLVFDLSARTDWMGKTVSRLRIDPGSTNAATFQIDYIATSNGDFDADGVIDTTESMNDLDADGQPDFTDLDVDGDGASDIAEIAAGRDQRDGLFEFGFNTADNFEGWTAANHLTGAVVTGGLLTAQLAGNDSQLSRTRLSFLASPVTAVVARMRCPSTVSPVLYWGRSDAGGISGTRLASGTYNGAGAWRTVLINLSGNAEWTNRITQFRFDPTSATTGTVDIDFIDVSTGDYDGDGLTDTVEGTVDTDSDTFANFADTDGDNDTMPDAYETANGFNRLVATDGTQDSDGDGMTNAAEYIAGTNPRASTDLPATYSAVRNAPGTQFQLRIAGKAGRLYRLMRSTTLGSGATWSQVQQTGPVSANGELIMTDSAPPATSAFYRVEITLQ